MEKALLDQHGIATTKNGSKPINGELAPLHPHELASPMVIHPLQQPEEESFISPRFLIRALTQWWYITVPSAVLLAVISAALVMLFFTPVYRATAVMKIASYTPYIAYSNNEQQSKPEEFTETQIELIRSPLVMEQVVSLDRVANMPEIREMDGAVGWLSDSVQVKRVGSSELYYVYLDAPQPENAAALVNAILDAYLAIKSRDDESQTKRVLELLNQEKQVRADRILSLKDEMREIGKKNLIGPDPITGLPDSKQVTATLDSLRDSLSDVEYERSLLEIRIKAIEESIAKLEVDPPAVQVEMAISDSVEIQNLRAMIAQKKEMLQRVEMAAAQGQDDPSYRRVAREVTMLERSLDNMANTARPLIVQQLKSMELLEQQDRLNDLKEQLLAQTELESKLRSRYEQKLKEVGDTGGQWLELEFKRAELSREESVRDRIAERAMALTTESRAPGRVTLLQPAEVPNGPVESLPLKNLVLAVFCSGCLPFGLVVLWELSVRRISDVDQLSHQSSINVVGEVARIPMRMRTISSQTSKAMNLFQESIDSLRVGLVLPEEYQDVQVLAVASAVHSEGKSSISSQLAVSIGRSTGQPVLLIDGDLRAPDVHHIFQVSNKRGFASVLDGRATLDEAIIKDWSDHLHLLPAGRLRHSPHKIISVESLQEILDELRPKYPYIVIDTPPILSASEALLMAKAADAAILCTRRNVSRESQVRIAYERLLKAGARPLGAVFNGVPTRSYAYTYGSYDYSPVYE